jgi:hypothetical protein
MDASTLCIIILPRNLLVLKVLRIIIHAKKLYWRPNAFLVSYDKRFSIQPTNEQAIKFDQT